MTKQELLEEKLTETNRHIVGVLREMRKVAKNPQLFEATKTVCAWCGRVISKGELVDGAVSHGICSDCNKKAVAQAHSSED